MKNNINVGVVGLGRLGSLYAQYLVQRIQGVRLVAIAEPDAQLARKIAEEYGVDHVFDNYQDMLDLKALDAVIITSPTNTHRDIVVDSAESNKAIFCEKPLSLSLSEATEMKEVVERTGVFFHMGFMRRFDTGYEKAKKMMDSDEIGNPVVFKATSRDPFRPSLEFADPQKSGGIFLDMGIHDFDLARWFMGEVAEVYSTGNLLVYTEMEEISEIDNAMVNLSFESGALGMVDLSRSGIYGYDIRTEILGSKGTLQIGYLRETPVLKLNKNGVCHDTVPFFMERFETAYVHQLDLFVQRLREQGEPLIAIQDGLNALAISGAAAASFRNRKAVQVDYSTTGFEAKS